MRQRRGVDTQRLEDILLRLNTVMTNLRNVDGQLGKQIRDHEFLKSILQRGGLPGGDCDFDMPLYFFWLELPHAQRVAQLQEWTNSILPLRHAVELLLSLIRGSSIARDEIAQNGFFQKTLDNNTTVQLVRIVIHKADHYFPEVSGSKHRFNIRFMDTEPMDHPQQTQEHVRFKLTTCVL